MDEFKSVTLNFLFYLRDYIIRMDILKIQVELDRMKIDEDCDDQSHFFMRTNVRARARFT